MTHRPTAAPARSLAAGRRTASRRTREFVNAGGFNDQAVAVDFAFARVGLGGKGATGTLDLDAVTGGYGLKTERRRPSRASSGPSAIRRPAVQGQGPHVLRRDARQRPVRCGHVGHGLQHDRRLVRRPWLADTTNPGTTEGVVGSLNSYGYSGQSVMYGPKFTSETTAVQSAVKSGSGRVCRRREEPPVGTT